MCCTRCAGLNGQAFHFDSGVVYVLSRLNHQWFGSIAFHVLKRDRRLSA
jgi:hypothetical protein